MSYRVQWSASALDRLIEILDFIAKDRPGAAVKVVDDIQARVEILADFPRMGPVFSADSGPDIRRLILGNFIVVYQIREPKNEVSIIAVRDSRQRPLTLEELLDEK